MKLQPMISWIIYLVSFVLGSEQLALNAGFARRELSISESNRFTEGVDKGLHFLDLKQIRNELTEIAALSIRKSSFLDGFVPTRK